jgi:hypothetical protein
VLSFLVSGRRCADDVPRVGSLLPCVGYTSVQRVMGDDCWLPAERSTAMRASRAHSGEVPPARLPLVVCRGASLERVRRVMYVGTAGPILTGQRRTEVP